MSVILTNSLCLGVCVKHHHNSTRSTWLRAFREVALSSAVHYYSMFQSANVPKCVISDCERWARWRYHTSFRPNIVLSQYWHTDPRIKTFPWDCVYCVICAGLESWASKPVTDYHDLLVTPQMSWFLFCIWVDRRKVLRCFVLNLNGCCSVIDVGSSAYCILCQSFHLVPLACKQVYFWFSYIHTFASLA